MFENKVFYNSPTLSFSCENANVSGDVFNEKLEEQSWVYVLFDEVRLRFFFVNGIRVLGLVFEVTNRSFF